MIFQQHFDEDTWTLTYFIADPDSHEAVIIDPVNSHLDSYMSLLNKHAMTLKYSLETHVHADHITAGGLLRQRTGAETGIGAACGAETADYQIQDGDVFNFGGKEQIKVIATPGHTPGSNSFLWRDRVFTGDALFIDGCGRTDFQGGNPGTLYDSITQKLFTLPADTLVYPGHDYNGRRVSSIEQERARNPRIAGKSREEFIQLMNQLDLPEPRLIKQSVPANRRCGLTDDEWQEAVEPPSASDQGAQCGATASSSTPSLSLVSRAKADIIEVSVDDAKKLIGNREITVVDVREPSEFEAGALPNAIPIPRGLLEFKIGNIAELSDQTKPVLVYCRTGGRAALATQTMQQIGYTNVVSLAGGYDAWTKD